MGIFNKEIDEITESDLLDLEHIPNNYESHRLDYKVNYIMDDRHKLEFLRDINSFANTYNETSLIIYGMTDNKKLIGMERKLNINEDDLQNHWINLLETSIQPKIKEFVNIQPVSMKSGKFSMIIKIFKSTNLIYGIKRESGYEFWYRASGNKLQMTLDEIVKHIRYANNPNLIVYFKIFNKRKKNVIYTNEINVNEKLKKSRHRYIQIKFLLRNNGEGHANNILIRIYCKLDLEYEILNKLNYNKKELGNIGVNGLNKKKKLKKMQNPSIVPTNMEKAKKWALQFKIERINRNESQNLPPIYIKIPINPQKNQIKFRVKTSSNESVVYNDQVLIMKW